MKKTIAMVAGAALIAGLSMGVANAQSKATGPFADVPTDHWSYQSVEKLRSAGIVIGYPDGTYGGTKAMTRYEFATAIARLLKLLPDGEIVTKDELSGYIAKGDLPDTSGFATKSDVDALKADLLNRLEAHDGAIAALRDLVQQYSPELKQLGVDVAAANARIDALDKRVTALEEEVNRVKITGEANFSIRSDVNTNATAVGPVDKDGYRIGADGTGSKGSTSIFNQPAAYDDFLLNIVGKVSDSAKAVVSIDAGNVNHWLGSSTSAGYNSSAASFHQSGYQPATSFNLYKAYLTTPVSALKYDGSAEIGRFGTQFTALTLKAINPDSYTNLPETSTGNVIMDGMKTEGDAYGLKLAAFAGKVASADGYGLSANGFGSGTGTQDGGHRPGSTGVGGENFAYNGIDNIGGIRLGLPTIYGYTINLTGVWARNASTSTVYIDPINGKQYNNLAVFGADLTGSLPFGIGVTGEYAQDMTGIDSKFGSVNSTKYTQAWNAGLDYNLSGINLKATYQQIYPNYDAPGSWDQIGSWVNPSNIKGVKIEAAYPITSSIAFKANGSSYKAITNVGAYSPLGPDDKVAQASANVDWNFSKTSDLDLGYEWVQWDLSGRTLASSIASGKPLEQYVTIGVGHSLGKNAAIKALYQIISYDDKSTGFDTGGNTHGGVFVTQASLKF
jgi:hypothetical protein